MRKTDRKVIYEGPSLETYLTIKNRLSESNIPYEDHTKQTQGLFQLAALIFTIGRVSTGTNSERNYNYQIFVSPENYDKAVLIAGGRG